MKRCSLCGGKLDREKRCTFCGLDNTKNDDQYKHLLNQSGCAHEPLTHVHEDKVQEKAPKKNDFGKQYSGSTYPSANYSKPKQAASSVKKVNKQKNTGSSKGCVTAFAILMIILTIGGSVLGFVVEMVQDVFSEESYYYTEEESGYDPYEYAEYQLSEDGEVYVDYLEPGIYTVGLHIPEGTYQISLTSGEYGGIEVNDSQNSIFLYESLEYKSQEVVEDIRLYNGGYFTVDTGGTVEVYSENAQHLVTAGIKNPLTETVIVTEAMTAGVDFPAGVYDICHMTSDESEYGWVEYSFKNSYMYSIYFDGMLGKETYHNVTLEEGAEITLDELQSVTLIPSELISTEDYGEFYELYW